MLILAAFLLAAPQVAAKSPEAKPVCRVTETSPAMGTATPTVRPLGREPNATQVLAVLRTQGGCITPVVVSDSVGGGAPRR